MSEEKAERGQRLADNIRYGQQISEEGIGGKTTESEGTPNQGMDSSRAFASH